MLADGNDQANADSLGNTRGQAHVGKPFCKTQPERGSRKSAGQNAHQSNTNLHGRQKSTGITCECEGAARAKDLAVDQGPQPSASRGDDSEFRQRKKAVYED